MNLIHPKGNTPPLGQLGNMVDYEAFKALLTILYDMDGSKDRLPPTSFRDGKILPDDILYPMYPSGFRRISNPL
jgi:hypothetical protein